MRLAFIAALACLTCSVAAAARAEPPRLVRQGTTKQLIVDGRPFLILGGELGNSTASDLGYLKPHWAEFRRLHMNTVLAPVYWELIEPEERRFDWSLVDGLIAEARAADERLVLLWFGSWKNSMSSYAPAWIKLNQARFPRTETPGGEGSEILSPLSPANLAADSRAFAALMAHLTAIDGERNTVLMMQVENEVGMLPTARDHSPAADAAFKGPVPRELMTYLSRHRDQLAPELKALWEANGAKMSGDWAQVFGPGSAGEEVFTAWTLARYVDAVARAGKAVYDLPMYVNAAQNRPGRTPGQYPSGGPVPHLIDVWKAGAPTIDLIAPDIYFPDFGQIAAHYDRPDNPLFIPEADRAGRPQTPSEAAAAFGRYDAFGFSPFSIESVGGAAAEPLERTYDVLQQIAPLILSSRGLGRMAGFRPEVSYEGLVRDAPQTETLGGYRLTAEFKDAGGPRADTDGALVIALGPDEFLVVGSGVRFSFVPATPGPPLAGLLSVYEGRFVDGRWTPGRRLNGDQTNQGRNVDLPAGLWTIQRVKLYRYR